MQVFATFFIKIKKCCIIIKTNKKWGENMNEIELLQRWEKDKEHFGFENFDDYVKAYKEYWKNWKY